MKAKRILFLVMAIFLASGVKAQFYDGPDDIYYYVYYHNGKLLPMANVTGRPVNVFNFDGEKACNWGISKDIIQNWINSNPNYFEDAVETKEYNLSYVSSNSSETIYKSDSGKYTYKFSSDRNTMLCIYESNPMGGHFYQEIMFKRVGKSFFRVGRSRTPNSKLYE